MIRRSLVAIALLSGSLTGCKCSPKPPAPAAQADPAAIEGALAGAKKVAAGDLDGDGQVELVAADDQSLRIIGVDGTIRATVPAPGAAIQVLRVADLDGDGKAEILAGWGRSAQLRNARSRVVLYRLAGEHLDERVLLEPTSERHQIVQLLPLPGNPMDVLAAWFTSKYDVSIAQLPLDGSPPKSEATVRMATAIALGDVDGDGTPDVVIGRPYGDTAEAEGDAFVLRPDGSRVPIPVRGGASSIALVDRAGGGLDILLGDGWNRNYGKLARALLTRARWNGQGFDTEVIEESEGEFVFWGIDSADLDGDGRPEIITRGSDRVHVLSPGADGLEARQIAGRCDDLVAVNLDDGGADELLLLCSGRATVYRGD